MKHSKRISRFLAFLLCSSMLLTLAVADALAAGSVKPAAKDTDPMVRVLLRRINVTNRIDLQLESPYGLTLPNEAELYFEENSVLSFRLHGKEMYLYYENMTAKLNKDCVLKRYTSADPEAETGFRLTNAPALYKGDLRLKIEDDKLLPIVSMHVEDYLQGVVPYEMSEYFPLEALKAQTVAARTYVFRKRNPSRDYDVVDTTSDQVFKGYLPNMDKCMQAIRETEGVCGYYRDKLAQCYYSASNGGRTELVGTVWQVKKNEYAYYASVNDPYDLENPSSPVRRVTLQKKYTNKGKDVAPYSLRLMLASLLEDELSSRGLDTSPESIQVTKIHSLSLDHVPEGKKQDFQAAANIHLEVSIKGRTREDSTPATGVTITILDTDQLDSLDPADTPAPTSEPVYGKFELIPEPFQVVIPIFPMAEETFGMDLLSNYQNEIWSLVEKEKSYILEARRYGHGVGMSQRGAEWMAKKYGKTYEEILAFYYPGMELKRCSYQQTELPTASEELRATMGPALSPTPLPTLMPLNLEPGKGQWIAVVTGIAEDSTLNLRSQPSLGGEILMRLNKYQRLLVLERCQEEGWVKVRTDHAEGYVMENYLSKE